ncbi:hypothetical protein [Oceanospirillum maris]|uniref:hypothetical protein n=1 Tax=Oceanospirillum maris TaxID=64977 RepID=UPI000402C893|nr:hypothetical protein [Oceanospirillum maris]
MEPDSQEITDKFSYKPKKITPALKQEIDQARAEAGLFYRFDESEVPLLIQSQDGTASGKTYSVFKQYLDAVNPAVHAGEGHRNLVFITPLKSQIDLPAELLALAAEKQVRVLPFLSIADLEFIPWGQEPQGEKSNNTNRYRRWITQGKRLFGATSSVYIAFSRLDALLTGQLGIEQQIKAEYAAGALDSQDQLKDKLRDSRLSLVNQLRNTCLELLDAQGEEVDQLVDLVEKGKSQKGQLALEMLEHLFPFQIALYRRCILLATTKKFDGNVTLLRCNQEGHFTRSERPLDHLIGQKKTLKENPLGEIAQLPHTERLKALKEEYFPSDVSSPFLQRDIRFTLVLDEEHDAYQIFQESVTKVLLSENVQLPSLFAALHRVLEFVDGCAEDARALSYTPLKEYVDAIHAALKKCDLRTDFELKKLTRLFQNSLADIVVDGRNSEQVIALIGHVFSYQIQRFYREADLKRIRLRSHGRSSYTEIYVADEDSEAYQDDNFSLYEVYQTTTAVLAASAQLTKPGPIQNMLSQQEHSNHNNPLSVFIGTAQAIKGEARYLLAGKGDHDQLIDDFFTYFQPKTLFALSPRDRVKIQAKELKGWILLKFRMELIKELPEIALLRMLYQTKNTVMLLSATSGFPGTYNGQYSRPFLQAYSHDLGVAVRRRDTESASQLAHIRKLRTSFRPVDISIFNDEQLQLSPQISEPDFKSVYEYWLRLLSPYLTDIRRNRYHNREFIRHLQAILLAAYNQQHTLSIGLSSRVFSVLGRFVRDQLNSATPLKNIRQLDHRQQDEPPRVFEIKPFKGKNHIRVVLFDSMLNREDDVREYLKVDDTDVTLCMVSHFKGAGTGLNYYVTYPDPLQPFQVDFQNMSMVCGSYWSQVNQQTNHGCSRNTLANYITLLKHYAHSGIIRSIDDFDTDLLDSDSAQLLEREHCVEVFKTAMQTIGRTERRDAIMQSQIRLPYDVHLNAMRVFRDLEQYPDAETLRVSLSLHNDNWRCRALSDLEKASFMTDDKRKAFEQQVQEACELYDEFDQTFQQHILQAARQGNPDALAFNEAFRHPDSFTNPSSYIKRLLKNAIVKNDVLLQACIKNFYLQRDDSWKNVILAQEPHEPFGLTDLANGTRPYLPELILPQHHQDMTEVLPDLEQKLFKQILNTKPDVLQKWIPIPKLRPMLIGNIGEWQFSLLLQRLGISPLSPDEVCEHLGAACYEKFDFYFLRDGHLLAVDVKNWQMTGNNREQGRNLFSSAHQKLCQVTQAVAKNPAISDVKAVYLNTRYSRNAQNDRSEQCADQALYFMNLFKSVPYYQDAEKKHKTRNYIAAIHYQLRVNPGLLALLPRLADDTETAVPLTH